jgi:hypothetical protein
MAKGKVIKSSSGKPFLDGGSTKMFGKQHAGTRKSLSAAGTGKADSSTGGKFIKGGKGHMFGKQSAGPRRPGVTGK